MAFARTPPDLRVCFVDCQKEAPECHCRARMWDAEADHMARVMAVAHETVGPSVEQSARVIGEMQRKMK